MNMAEAKRRPLPKPRARQKPMPGSAISSTNVSPKLPPSAIKPPLTKPKPPAYKPLDFSNKSLVNITADIDIEVDSTNSDHQATQDSDRFETNNNVVNSKHIDGKIASLSENGFNKKKAKETASGLRYAKPLPPLPMQIPVEQPQEESNSNSRENLEANAESKSPKLPRKPPRQNASSSDSKLAKDGPRYPAERGPPVLLEPNDVISGRKRNPPLPRKPTVLRRSTAPEEIQSVSMSSTFCLDSTEMENINGKSKDSRIVGEGVKLHTSSSDSQLSKSPKPSSYLRPGNRDGVSNVSCTPPLPRKPPRKPLPELNQGADSHKNNRVTVNSLPDKSRPTDETDSASNIADSVFEANKHNNQQDDRQTNIGSSRSNSSLRRPPPDRPPPPLNRQAPSPDPSPSHGPPRRTPPNLPKRPSLDGKQKSTPPPLPNAPRPPSIARGNAVKLGRLGRSQSEGNLFEARPNDSDSDPEYCEAYQHLRESVHFPAPSKAPNDADVDTGDYESPDKDMVKDFMDARQQKAQTSLKKNESSALKKRNRVSRLASTTYSSSSDDSEHEYVEPLSPTPEKRMTIVTPSPTNTVSSGGSSNYVEAIHVSELNNTVNSESKTKKYEFKPFSDMDSEWSEPKVIDWEYDGESDDDDDSDASYVEPDAIDDDYDLDDGDDEAFTDEPLYQMYQAVVLEKERTMSLKRPKKGNIISPGPTSPGMFTLRTGTLRGGKMLWSQIPEVRNSGLLENVSAEQRKLQEAIFEVITSEASYLKSLNLLLDHFLSSPAFSPESSDAVLDKHQVYELFSNIREIVKVSERFLEDLRSRQRQSVLIESVSDIITDHATNHFQAYVTYCSTQYKQDRALTNLRKSDWRFAEELDKLEKDSCVFGLTLQSFLVLPMQRVTRYPLLVDAIVRRCEPGHSEYYKTDGALKAVNQVVHKCNEGARNEERREEMTQINKLISFIKMNPIKLVEDDRWLLRRGPLQLLEFETKSTLGNTLRGRFKKYRVKSIYLFLFSDLLVVTKKKTETVYSVIDYAKRNMIRIQESTSTAKNAFLLVFLENFEKKTKELSVRADNETDLTRWKEAFEPPSASTDDEKIYGSWDCPQVQALHDYQAHQSDELSLVPGDVVNVLRKLPDGWYEGERIRDGVCGWFPANHTEEIRNEHVRARNLHQRYRLLAASTAFLDTKKR